MSQEESRDDANIKHFSSRAQQTNSANVAGGPANTGRPQPALNKSQSPVQLFMIFDQNPATNFETDNIRYNYIGTSPQISQYSNSCSNARRMRQYYI